MTKTRVLHITFDMGIGGTEQVIRQIVEGTRHQLEHILLCIDGKVGSMGQALEQNGIEVISYARGQGFDTKLISYIRRLIKSHEIGIVHCHQYTPYVYGVLGAILSRAKVIFTEHGRFYPDVRSPKRCLINPVLARFTQQIVAISEATADALEQYENFNRAQIEIIYNGIKDYAVEPPPNKETVELKLSKDTLVVGIISRLDPIKNHNMLFRAFKKVLQKKHNIVLLVVGGGPLQETLESTAKELGIEQQLIFSGYQNNPLDWLEKMDIFALSSFSEGTSMTLLEAMCLSKPIVATDVGGNPEVVEHDKTGYITANNDHELFAEAILKLVEDPESRRIMGHAGRERFLEKFVQQIMTDQYLNLYRQCENRAL